LSGVPASMERLDGFYELGFKSTEDYSSLKLKIGLMEKQLQEAKKKNYSEERIATEIAADLVELYLKASLYQEAFQLFEDYHSYYDNAANIKFINLCGNLYLKKSEWDKALTYFLKSEQISLEVGDKAGLGATYNDIGWIYDNKGEFDKALTYFLKSEQISLEVGDKAGLGKTYNDIGRSYRKKGQLDKALSYFLKSEGIRIEVGDKAGLGTTYNNIGILYANKSEWDKALTYFLKSEQIRVEVGNRAGLGWSYNNIGFIYYNKSEIDRALTYLLKSEQIWIEVGYIAGLGWTYFNIGTLYLQKNDKERANTYLILAGYIAKIKEMKHELSQWADALNPLIEEMGEERFMEEGKRLLEERMKDVPANLNPKD